MKNGNGQKKSFKGFLVSPQLWQEAKAVSSMLGVSLSGFLTAALREKINRFYGYNAQSESRREVTR